MHLPLAEHCGPQKPTKKISETRNCPKCRSLASSYIEVGEVCTIHDVNIQGEITWTECDETKFSPVRVECFCNCGHRWTMRGVSQLFIEDI